MGLSYFLRSPPLLLCSLVLPCACGTDERSPDADSVHAGGARAGGHPSTRKSGTIAIDGRSARDDAGTGGSDAGSGGSETMGGAAPESPECLEGAQCNDGNSCTQDTCDEGRCVHLNLVDGTPCVESSFCTVNSSCTAGECVGQTLKSQPSYLGATHASGESGRGSYALGTSAFVAPGVLIDVDGLSGGSRLTLRKRSGEQLVTTSSVWSDLPYKSFSSSGNYWLRRQASHIMPLSGRRFCYLSGSKIEVYSFTTGSLILLSSQKLAQSSDPSGVTITRSANRDIIWLVAVTGAIAAYSVNDVGAVDLLSVTQLPAAVYTVDAVDSGESLWLGTDNQGLLELDVSDLTNVHTTGRKALARDQFFVQAHGGLLLSQELLPLSDRGALVLLREDTLEEIARFKEEQRWLTGPVSGRILSSNRVLVQWHEDEQVTARIYEVTGSDTLNLVQETPYFAGSHRVWYPQAAPLTGEAFDDGAAVELVVEPHRSPLRINVSKTVALTGPSRGGFRDIVADSKGNLFAFGRASSHQIKVTKSGLSLEGGGRYELNHTEGLHVFQGSAQNQEARLVNQSFNRGGLAAYWEEYDAGRSDLLLLEPDDGLPRPSRRLGLSGKEVLAGISSSMLYQVTRSETGGDWGLQTASLAQLGLVQELKWQESLLQGEWGETGTSPNIAVDHLSGQLLVSFRRLAEVSSNWLYWFVRDQDEFQFRAALELPTGSAPFLFGEQAFLIRGENTLQRIGRTDQQIVVLQERVFADTSIDALLHADEEVLLLAARHKRADGSIYHLLALDAQTLETLYVYPSENPVTSVASLGERFAYGSRTSVTLATPPCGTQALPDESP